MAVGNTDDPASHFATICKPGSGWAEKKISGLDAHFIHDQDGGAEVGLASLVARRRARRALRSSSCQRPADPYPSNAPSPGLSCAQQIVGRMSQSAIGILVERASRYLRLVHLPDGHRADHLLTAVLPVLDELPAAVRRTLTWDQGSEMARHAELVGHFAEGIYFAHPASP